MSEGSALQSPEGTARLSCGRTPVQLPMAPFHQIHHAVSTEVVLHISPLQLTAEISLSHRFKHLGVILIALSLPP